MLEPGFLEVFLRMKPIKEAKKLRKTNGGIITLGGIVFIFIATIPIVNLIAPFWGIALMTHLFHGYYDASKPKEKGAFKIL